jgi:hypothetical protein
MWTRLTILPEVAALIYVKAPWGCPSMLDAEQRGDPLRMCRKTGGFSAVKVLRSKWALCPGLLMGHRRW